MNILGETTFSGASLRKAVDLTTGSQPGSFTFDAPATETSGLVTTPVSTVDTKMTGNIADALQDLPNLPAGQTFSSFNPMSVAMQAAQDAQTNGTNALSGNSQEAQNYSKAAQVDSVGAQLQTIINGMEVFIGSIDGIESTDPYNDALNAVASALDSEASSNNKLQLTEWQDVQAIFNSAAQINLETGAYSAAITAASKIIAEINTEIASAFSNDFLSDDARSLAAVAQSDVVSLLGELAASPTPDVASSFEQGFNPGALTTQYSNALPGFSAVAGPTKIIAGLDRHSTKVNQLSKVDLIANDIFLGDGSTPNIIALSTSATDFTSNRSH